MLTDDIEWIAAAGDYAELHGAGRHHLLRETMNSLVADAALSTVIVVKLQRLIVKMLKRNSLEF